MNTIFKKISILFSMLVVLTLVACSGDSSESSGNTENEFRYFIS